MMIAEVSIVPVGKGESVSIWVARAVEVIDRSGLKYQVGPMGTCIEGEWEQIAPVIGQCLRALSRDCRRVQLSVRADYRPISSCHLEDPVRSVARTVGHPVPC
ncbi:MAG: MTH1187 family thiamine-binding protein [Planctomycetes bacterium]|nr:MTH1187 family thiamine-binding protein [Planctomycetota bacterium]